MREIQRKEENKVDERYCLMNKDKVLLTFACTSGALGSILLKEEACNVSAEELPIGFSSIHTWVEQRQAPKHREHIAELMRQCGCSRIDGFLKITHALSLNDTFWVKPIDSSFKWADVSLFRNPFNDAIAKIAFEGGLYGEQFSTTSPEFETSGAYAKCWVREEEGDIFLYKRGSTGGRNTGLEPFSEAYAAEIASRICRRHVPYTVVRYRGSLASKCPLFTSEQEGFAPIYRCIQGEYNLTNVMDYMSRHDAEEDFRRMLVLDALVLNTDRHAGNYGMLFDTDTMQVSGMAPVFDHNQALLPYAEQAEFDHLQDYLSTRPTRIGEDFNEVAHAALTPAIRADLINLKGFRFDREHPCHLPEERLKILEEVVNEQIDGILKLKRLYMPSMPEAKEPEKKEKMKKPVKRL